MHSVSLLLDQESPVFPGCLQTEQNTEELMAIKERKKMRQKEVKGLDPGHIST